MATKLAKVCRDRLLLAHSVYFYYTFVFISHKIFLARLFCAPLPAVPRGSCPLSAPLVTPLRQSRTCFSWTMLYTDSAGSCVTGQKIFFWKPFVNSVQMYRCSLFHMGGASVLSLLTLYNLCSMQSRVIVMLECPSVCLSHSSTAALACGGFAAECRPCGQEITIESGGRPPSIARAAARHSAGNVGSAILTDEGWCWSQTCIMNRIGSRYQAVKNQVNWLTNKAAIFND